MAISVSSPVTGAAQTGLTSPTYTIAADQAPDVNGKQYSVTALGGTQTGVSVHSVSQPFTTTFWRPKVPKVLGPQNPTTGDYASVDKNVYKHVTRKAVEIASGVWRVLIITTTAEVPAGADGYDPESVRAALSLHIGTETQIPSGVGDTLIAGTL